MCFSFFPLLFLFFHSSSQEHQMSFTGEPTSIKWKSARRERKPETYTRIMQWQCAERQQTLHSGSQFRGNRASHVAFWLKFAPYCNKNVTFLHFHSSSHLFSFSLWGFQVGNTAVTKWESVFNDLFNQTTSGETCCSVTRCQITHNSKEPYHNRQLVFNFSFMSFQGTK